MCSTGDIQFFVCRSRIIPEPPFPSQGIAGSGNEIADMVIEIINNTRGGIVMFFTEKKGDAFIGGQVQVPDAGPGADWLS